MSAPTVTAAPPAASFEEFVLVPAESFFVRRIAIDTGADVAAQVELALETSAPFGVNQLYHGYFAPAGSGHALVFATHRRLFAAEGWDGAAAVLPSFVALLGDPPTAAKIRLWRDGATLSAAAWDGSSPLPAVVLSRRSETGASDGRDELLAEVGRRLGVDAPVEEFSGTIHPQTGKGGAVEFSLAGGGGRKLATTLDVAAVETMDIRDKAVLAARKQTQRRDRVLWGALLGAVGVLVLAGVLELGLVAGRHAVARQQEATATLAPAVERIQTAQALGTRIEEMSRRRLRPFEMLAVLNAVRPSGVQFTRSVTSGQGGMELEAQTANADSVGAFETALRALPSLETVEVRDLRLREGVTTFQLIVSFRAGTLAGVAGTEGGAP